MNLRDIKLSTKALLDLSAIIDKMNIKDQLFAVDKKTNKEVAEEIFKLLVANIHNAEDEILNFIIDYKKLEDPIVIENENEMTAEEYEKVYNRMAVINRKKAYERAKDFNVIEIFQDLFKPLSGEGTGKTVFVQACVFHYEIHIETFAQHVESFGQRGVLENDFPFGPGELGDAGSTVSGQVLVGGIINQFLSRFQYCPFGGFLFFIEEADFTLGQGGGDIRVAGVGFDVEMGAIYLDGRLVGGMDDETMFRIFGHLKISFSGKADGAGVSGEAGRIAQRGAGVKTDGSAVGQIQAGGHAGIGTYFQHFGHRLGLS